VNAALRSIASRASNGRSCWRRAGIDPCDRIARGIGAGSPLRRWTGSVASGGAGLCLQPLRSGVPFHRSKEAACRSTEASKNLNADQQAMHAEHADAAFRYGCPSQPRTTAQTFCHPGGSVHLRALRASFADLRWNLCLTVRSPTAPVAGWGS
jgi:hypothetical protein